MRSRPRLLVSEIHPFNLLMFWFLSLFLIVESPRVSKLCPRIFSRRIAILDISRHLSWSEVQSFRSRVLEQWESTSKKIPRGDWNITYRGLRLDFTAKANQSLAHDFERLLL